MEHFVEFMGVHGSVCPRVFRQDIGIGEKDKISISNSETIFLIMIERKNFHTITFLPGWHSGIDSNLFFDFKTKFIGSFAKLFFKCYKKAVCTVVPAIGSNLSN